MKTTKSIAILALSISVAACGGGGDGGVGMSVADADTASPESPATAPFQELYDQGVDRLLGVYTPMLSTDAGDGVVTHAFGEGDGPLCYTGNPFSMSTRDGTGEELLIFLQGGGLCSPNSCEAIEEGIPFINFGILSSVDPQNPTRGFDVGYIPYCDGSFHIGDNDVDSDGDGANDRFFRGLHNLSASLDVIARTYPAPSRIVIAGNSAGGFGVHYALPLVRRLYPDQQIDLINDSGVGIQRPGLQESLNEYWNSGAFFPESCETCIGDDGHQTDYHKYQLEEDGNLRMSYISSTEDEVAFASLSLEGTTPGDEVVRAVRELEDAFPERFRGLVPDNDEHTFILRQFDFAVAGTTVKLWLTSMLNGSGEWVTLVE